MEGLLSFLTENGLAILLTAAVAYLLGQSQLCLYHCAAQDR